MPSQGDRAEVGPSELAQVVAQLVDTINGIYQKDVGALQDYCTRLEARVSQLESQVRTLESRR